MHRAEEVVESRRGSFLSTGETTVRKDPGALAYAAREAELCRQKNPKNCSNVCLGSAMPSVPHMWCVLPRCALSDVQAQVAMDQAGCHTSSVQEDGVGT